MPEPKPDYTPQRFHEGRRAQYLVLLRKGHGRFKAARKAGVHPSTVKRYVDANPAFKDEIVEAEAEAMEPIEDVLYTKANDGEPWAVKLWLERRNAAKWGEKAQVLHTHTGSVEIEPAGVMKAVAALAEQLQQRADQSYHDAPLQLGEISHVPDPIEEAEVIEPQYERIIPKNAPLPPRPGAQ